MAIYYPGDGSTAYTGEDKKERVEELRREAEQHDNNSDTYQRIGGYSGAMAGEAFDARQKRREADRIERYGK